MKAPKKNIVVPRGFLFASGVCGLRTHGSGPDLALMYSVKPAHVAALFTSNRVKAAPVLLSQQHLRRSGAVAQMIIANAGNANCATGASGMAAARECSKAVSNFLHIPQARVLVASTGVIGVPLDPQCIIDQTPMLVRRLHPEGWAGAARAIMTTDTQPKVASRSITVSGRRIAIFGMSKGAGMIYPRLVPDSKSHAALPHATMLAFLFTDANVEPRFLQSSAQLACELSFNRISIDGDTSTNDTLFVLANGMAGGRTIGESSPSARRFIGALLEVAQELALAMVRDGEGAKKVAEIRVESARSEKQAEVIARSIALSPLVKTALAGADPNWGRILSAVGNAGVPFNPAAVDIYINRMRVCRNGEAAEFSEKAASRLLQAKEVVLRVVLRQGQAAARFWTCDFTEEYIRINASYRT